MGVLPQIFYTTVGLGKETSWGSVATPTVWLPAEQPRFNPSAFRHVLDTGLRGQPSLEFDLIGGPGEGTVQWQGNVYDDSIGILLANILGSDTKTGVGPYTHLMKVAAAPPSHTLQWVQGVNAYDFKGLRLSQLQFNFRAGDGALTYTAQGTSKLAVVNGSPTSTSYGTLQPQPGWRAAITVGGGAPAALLEAQLTITRALRLLHGAAATQDLTNIHPGPVQVTGRLTFQFTQVTEYGYYNAATPTQNAVVLTFNQAAADQIIFTVTKAGWRTGAFEVNDNIYTMVADVNGIYNATDGGPAAISVINSVSAAYT